MLHLVYQLELTEYAECNQSAFWAWLHDREKWFYEGLDMVIDARWTVCTIGARVHTLEHTVTFEDESAWGRYRHQVSARYVGPDGQARLAEQYRWWRILESSLRSDPPVPLGIGRATPPQDR